MHSVEEEHETLNRRLDGAAEGFGVSRAVQVVPFHDSENAWLLLEVPTATQAVSETQSTEARTAPTATLGGEAAEASPQPLSTRPASAASTKARVGCREGRESNG
jgi:hypothetical protein